MSWKIRERLSCAGSWVYLCRLLFVLSVLGSELEWLVLFFSEIGVRLGASADHAALVSLFTLFRVVLVALKLS